MKVNEKTRTWALNEESSKARRIQEILDGKKLCLLWYKALGPAVFVILVVLGFAHLGWLIVAAIWFVIITVLVVSTIVYHDDLYRKQHCQYIERTENAYQVAFRNVQTPRGSPTATFDCGDHGYSHTFEPQNGTGYWQIAAQEAAIRYPMFETAYQVANSTACSICAAKLANPV